MSAQDLVVAMLTISDNVATDALLHLVGIDAVSATSARLRLSASVITADLYTTINSIGRDAGLADFAALQALGLAATLEGRGRPGRPAD